MPQLESDNLFKSVRRESEAYLRSRRWKEVLVFLLFVLLAAAFWFLQNLQQNAETEIAVPVRFKNVPAEIAFADTLPEQIMIHVKDKGSVLLNYTLGRNLHPFEIDLKNLPVRKDALILENNEIYDELTKLLSVTTELLAFTPPRIRLRYNRRKEKELPVVFNGKVNLAPGFHPLGKTLVTPETVKVYGNPSLLDSLQSIETVFTEIKRTNKSVIRTVYLQKIKGIAVQPSAVTVTIPVEEFTDKTLEIPILPIDLPSHYTVRFFPPAVKVKCSIPLSRFKYLNEGDFAIRIPFSELTGNASGIVSVRLSEEPEQAYSVSLSPDKVEFILEQHSEHP